MWAAASQLRALVKGSNKVANRFRAPALGSARTDASSACLPARVSLTRTPFTSAMTMETRVTRSTPWWVYIIECRGARLYTGITNDVEQRYRAHAEGRGARFTKAFPPLRLMAMAQFTSKSAAARVEAAIKRLPRDQKLAELAAYAGNQAEPALNVWTNTA